MTTAVVAGRRVSAPRRSWAGLAIPAVVFTLAVYALPMSVLVIQSFTGGDHPLESYTRILSNPAYLATIGRTLGISAISAALALVIGYPVAYVIATAGPRLRAVLIVGVVAPYVTSILIRTFAWQVLLGRLGPVNALLEKVGLGPQDLLFTRLAVIIGLTHYVLPLTILPLVNVMRQIDRSQLAAAASLGAGPALAWVRVYLPQTRPGIEVALVLSFVYGVGAFVIPAILGGDAGSMLGVLIQSAIDQRADFGLAAAASALLAAAVLAVLVLYRAATGGSLESVAAPTAIGPSAARTRRRRTLGLLTRAGTAVARLLDRTGLSRRRGVLTAYSVLVCVLLALPQLVAVPVSFSSTRAMVLPPPGFSLQWYRNLFTPEWLEPLVTSFLIAVPVAVLSTALGTLAAIGVARGMGRRGQAGATVVLMLPLLFPTVVAAAAFYLSFLPLYLTDTVLGLVLAHTTIALPFAFALVTANIRALDPVYERAAASLGADRRRQLTRVLLPLLKGSVLTALFLTFLTSFDEGPIAIFLSGVDVDTLPRQMFAALTLQTDPTIAVVAVVSMAVSGLVMGLNALVGRSTRRTTTTGDRRAEQ